MDDIVITHLTSIIIVTHNKLVGIYYVGLSVVKNSKCEMTLYSL